MGQGVHAHFQMLSAVIQSRHGIVQGELCNDDLWHLNVHQITTRSYCTAISSGNMNLQTRRVEFLPKSYILVWSDHVTFSQSSSGSSKCSLANFRRAWTCTGLSRGTRLALQDLSPWRRSVLLMVGFVTLVPALCRSFPRSPVGFGELCSPFLWSFWPHGVRSCVEPQIEGDCKWFCMSSIS